MTLIQPPRKFNKDSHVGEVHFHKQAITVENLKNDAVNPLDDSTQKHATYTVTDTVTDLNRVAYAFIVMNWWVCWCDGD